MTTRPVVLIALAMIAGRPVGPGQRLWEHQVRDNLTRAVRALRQRGFTGSGEGPVGPLLTEQSVWYGVTLPAGRSYALVGVCDDDCSVLVLEVYGAGDTQLAAERSSNVPIVNITPSETRRYRVRVIMAACRMSPCWYGLAVLVTPPAP